MKKVARLRLPQDEFVPPSGAGLNKPPVESNVGVRTTGRIKKPKAVFDPSDNYVPRGQRVSQVIAQQQQQQQQHVTSPKAVTASSPTTAAAREKQRERSLSTGSNASNNSSSSQDVDVCTVCQKREPRRGGNYRNKLLTCISCNHKLHKWCASTDFLESSPVRQAYKCEYCRTCDLCDGNEQNSKGNADMMTCAKCVTSYHVACHTPKITKNQQTQRNWKCFKCVPNITSAVAKNNSKTSKEDPMPVTVIRQIIGYGANTQPLAPKTQPQAQATLQQSQKSELSSKEPQQEQTQSPPVHVLTPNRINMSVAPSKAQSQASSSAHSQISSSSSESDDASDDEDYKYVEKKKRKLVPESNNGHGNSNVSGSSNINDKDNGNGNDVDINMERDGVTDSEQEQKPILNAFDHTVDDLPKREVIKTWSVEKLCNYVQKFFPNEVQVFKEHEIDGNALLLLKRSDVVKKLPLKLGPSLRLYNFILKIQTQNPNDPTLGWDCSIDTLSPSTE